MLSGYRNKICYVDLTRGRIEMKELDAEMAKKFIGDIGINLRLAYDLIKPGIDPLSPDNMIIIGAGPLVGTRVQAPRWTAVTKYPLTGTIAFASAGMGFGIRLKRAGYDHLVISGHASKPVYLKISDDKVEICDASHLWGRDIFDTTEALWDELGKEYSIVAISQAGENLVRLALGLVDRLSTLGKGGMAAVMGAKNLKAIAVKGTGGVQVSDRERFDAFSKGILSRYREDPELKRWLELRKVRFERNLDSLPYKNFTELYPRAEFERVYSTDVYLSRIGYGRTGCLTCGYPCKQVLTVRQGEYKGLVTKVSSLAGRVRNLGYQVGAGSFENLVKLIDVANRYGIDSHTFAPVMMLAVELYERGIITNQDTEGLVLKSDFETTLSLLERVAFRRGIGDILADGAPGIIKKFGKECEKYSVHIKGLDPQADPRSEDFNVTAFCQVTNPEGGAIEPGHVAAWSPRREGFSPDAVRSYCQRMELSTEAIGRVFDVPWGFNVGRLTKVAEDFYILETSMGVCEYRTEFWDWNTYAEAYSSATGIEMTGKDMKEAGERIWNLFKALNVREGFDRNDDRFPERWVQPFRTADGREIPPMTCTGELATMDVLNKLLDDYYDERGWEVERGIPSEEKLVSLGLADIAADLKKLRILK